jgi:peptidoglycan/xylan/chitin deacetylase (PgdA/CDA1 family)
MVTNAAITVNRIRTGPRLLGFLAAVLFFLGFPDGGRGADAEAPALAPLEGELTTKSATRAIDSSTTFPAVIVTAPRDMLSTIARRHGTTVERILHMNPGLSRNRLNTGQALLVAEPWDHLPSLPHLERELVRGLRGGKQVALTFDASWTEMPDLERLLEVLEKRRAQASFFLTGIFLERHPDGAEAIARKGHRVYNHTRSHPRCRRVSDERIRSELLAVEDLIARTSATMTTRPFWRPPFGDSDARVLTAAATAGFRSVRWTIDSLDWMEDPPATAASVFRRVCERPFEEAGDDPDPLDGAIILFHASGAATPGALEKIIPHLRERGYTLTGLPELLEP